MLGPVIPGNFVTASPDALSALPASYTALPSPTMLVKAENLHDLALVMISDDHYLKGRIEAEAAARAAAFGALIRDVSTNFAPVAIGGAPIEDITCSLTGTDSAIVIAYFPAGIASVGSKVDARLAIDAAAMGMTSQVTLKLSMIQNHGWSVTRSIMSGSQILVSAGSLGPVSPAEGPRERLVIEAHDVVSVAGPLLVVLRAYGNPTELASALIYGTGALCVRVTTLPD